MKNGGDYMAKQQGQPRLVRFNENKPEDVKCLNFLDSEKENGRSYSYVLRKALLYYIENSDEVDSTISSNIVPKKPESTKRTNKTNKEKESDPLLSKFKATTSDDI